MPYRPADKPNYKKQRNDARRKYYDDAKKKPGLGFVGNPKEEAQALYGADTFDEIDALPESKRAYGGSNENWAHRPGTGRGGDDDRGDELLRAFELGKRGIAITEDDIPTYATDYADQMREANRRGMRERGGRR